MFRPIAGPEEPATQQVLVRRIQVTEGVLFQQLQLEAIDDTPYAFGPIRERVQGATRAALARQAAHYATARTDAVFLAMQQSTPVGTASVQWEAEQFWLSFVWVRPAWRKSGLAQTLLAQAALWCRDTGVRTLYARVLDENPHALRFYQREGWQVVGQEPWPSKPARTRFIICRPLDEGIA